MIWITYLPELPNLTVIQLDPDRHRGDLLKHWT